MEKKQDSINWAIPIVIATTAVTLAVIAMLILDPTAIESIREGSAIARGIMGR